MKLTTAIEIAKLPFSISLSDRICLLGSCFSNAIGSHLIDAGFCAQVNPFGQLYNPESIAAAVKRLDSGEAFADGECVQMGAGAQKFCSFWHHTSFARSSKEEFLAVANEQLAQSSAFWKSCNVVIITLGTAYVWRREGKTVANCLKRPACEFERSLLSLEQIQALLSEIVRSHPDKRFIFTVSPIRHLSDGAHKNTLSKSLLHLGAQAVIDEKQCCYFPAYEIVMDELRDYRFYAADLVHPRDITEDYIWERFGEAAFIDKEKEAIRSHEKASRSVKHHALLK